MTKSISRRQVLKIGGVAGFLGVAGLPGVAFAAEGSDEGRLFIGYSLHPIGPTANAGTFDMSVRFEDSGTSTAYNFKQERIGNSNRARISGDQDFVGQKGTIFTHFEGVAFPYMNPHAVGEGRFTILSGTGAYAGVGGRGTFLIVVDFTSNQLIGTSNARVDSSDASS